MYSLHLCGDHLPAAAYTLIIRLIGTDREALSTGRWGESAGFGTVPIYVSQTV